MKTAYLNGQFVSEGDAKVSILDRGFLYGDGLFETLLVQNGKPFRWQKHWERLAHGAGFMQIKLPLTSGEAMSSARHLLRENGVDQAILRINLSRGIGSRGYSAKNATLSVFAMTLHEAPRHSEVPVRWRLGTSELRVLANDPLARLKSTNKLVQVLAKTRAEQVGFDEALLLNSRGEVTEATNGNLFWIEDENVFTTPLDAGILPGITRSLIFEICQDTGVSCTERAVDVQTLKKAQGAFLTLSSLGIVELAAIDEHPFSSSELIGKLFQGYQRLVALETGNI